MRLNILLLFLALASYLSAQTLTARVTPFDGVEGSAIAFADVDGDDDQDVLIKILNAHGHVLLQAKEMGTIGVQDFIINMRTFPRGIYFMQLDNGKRKGIAKFLIK